MKRGKRWISAGAAFMLCACAVCRMSTAATVTDREISDVKRFSQDPSYYIGNTFKRNWIDTGVQAEQADGSLVMLFNPWVQAVHMADPGEKWGMDFFDVPRWGANLKRIGPRTQEELIAEADMEDYPSMKRLAIITSDTDARILPTDKPAFEDPAAGGGGFPFDCLQNSRFRTGTPVIVHHVSKSGGWLLVQGPCFSGWVRCRDVAFVSESFIRKYDSESYAAIISDGTVLKDRSGHVVATADIGSIFPVVQRRDDGFLLLKIPARASNGTARIISSAVTVENAALFPLAYSASNVSLIAGRLMGSEYGWGGLYGNRDCSQLVQELYLPFGFLLPRNSSAQREAFRNMPLSGLSSQEKIDAVKKYGVPFRTLLAFKGHIGIYVGTRGGEPLMMHCTWGVRLAGDAGGSDGRAVIGRTVISTLRPGREFPDAVSDSLLDRLTAIVFLPGSGVSQN